MNVAGIGASELQSSRLIARERKMPEQSFTIFISHAALDYEIAVSMKEFIASAFPAERVFVSSHPEDLMPGDGNE